LGSPTIPQIYIGGKHIGGATDLFKTCSNGTLAELPGEQKIQVKEIPEDFEPLSLLPGGLHKR